MHFFTHSLSYFHDIWMITPLQPTTRDKIVAPKDILLILKIYIELLHKILHTSLRIQLVANLFKFYCITYRIDSSMLLLIITTWHFDVIKNSRTNSIEYSTNTVSVNTLWVFHQPCLSRTLNFFSKTQDSFLLWKIFPFLL